MRVVFTAEKRQEDKLPMQPCQLKQSQQHPLQSMYPYPLILRTVNWGDLSESKKTK